MENNTKGFVVYSHKFAKYLAEHGVYWFDVRKDLNSVKSTVFVYEPKEQEHIEFLMKKYKEGQDEK